MRQSALLNADGNPDLNAYFEQAKQHTDVYALLAEVHAGRIKVVPFKRSQAELEGMMRSLVSAMEPLWPSFGRALPGLSQNSKTLKVVGNPANSIGQCLRFMAEFERKGHAAVVDVSGALVAGAHALVGFLNAGVLEVPEVDAVLAALAVGLENRPSL